MSDAFTVYVRNAESVLLMQRADGVADLPGAWDGIYGIGDPEDLDAVVARITGSRESMLRTCSTFVPVEHAA